VSAELAINILDGRHGGRAGVGEGSTSSFMSVCWYGRWF